MAWKSCNERFRTYTHYFSFFPFFFFFPLSFPIAPCGGLGRQRWREERSENEGRGKRRASLPPPPFFFSSSPFFYFGAGKRRARRCRGKLRWLRELKEGPRSFFFFSFCPSVPLQPQAGICREEVGRRPVGEEGRIGREEEGLFFFFLPFLPSRPARRIAGELEGRNEV